jgi:hypothetical protein
MQNALICGALEAFALSTQAAVAAERYIVQVAHTKKCTVVDPTTTTTTVVGDGVVYKTRIEAGSAIKTTKICAECPLSGILGPSAV